MATLAPTQLSDLFAGGGLLVQPSASRPRLQAFESSEVIRSFEQHGVIL